MALRVSIVALPRGGNRKQLRPSRSAASTASSSSSVPRAVLTSTAPGGSRARARIVDHVPGLGAARAMQRQETALRQERVETSVKDRAVLQFRREAPAVVVVDLQPETPRATGDRLADPAHPDDAEHGAGKVEAQELGRGLAAPSPDA